MRVNSVRRMSCALVTLLVTLGCGGGGSGGGDDNGGVTPTATCISFSAGAGPASGTATSAKGAGSVCTTVIVEVLLTDVNDVFTVSFDAVFDPDTARYDGFSVAGSHLSSDGAALQVIETTATGQVSLGITRSNPATGINFAGSQTVVKLMFVKASGVDEGDTASLTFSNTHVLGSEQPPVEKAGITWSGGTLSVD